MPGTAGTLQFESKRGRHGLGLVIPGAIWGEPVSSIGDNAFSGKKLTSVTIPGSVSSIGVQAFSYTRSISIGSNVSLELDSFPFNFANFYTRNGRRAGRYTYASSSNNVFR